VHDARDILGPSCDAVEAVFSRGKSAFRDARAFSRNLDKSRERGIAPRATNRQLTEEELTGAVAVLPLIG